MNKFCIFLIVSISLLYSCISTKEIRYLQPNENLEVNEHGLIPYNIPVYRVTKNDILTLNILTTPKGDAAQFYSSYNTTSNTNNHNANTNINNAKGGRFYFTGLKVDSKGDIYVFGIGYIRAEGRTLEDISSEIQKKVNENFLEGKSEVRLNIDGIRYYILGDLENTNISGEKVAHKNTITITEAIAMNGGLNRTIDRKNIVIHRKFPEGIKRVKIDLTRDDIMNSPYYWVQNGDEIFLNTKEKSLYGFGKDPQQTIGSGVSLLTTLMSLYLLLSRL